ncbi:MAG: hypothetical protein EB060_03895 [Proteobacteria bacterium]|nr:hypothetical protein [Pseudomonadota bacterium]
MKRFGRLPDKSDEQAFLKTIVVAMLVVTVGALSVLGYVHYKSQPHGLSKDPDLATLEIYEHNKDYTKLINTLYTNRDKAYSTKVLPWLHDREDKGFAPYYYAQALHMNNLGNQKEAILYYFAGGLVARIDLLRCLDKTAETMIAALESPFPDVPKYLEENPGNKVSAGTFAVEMEEFTKDRSPAEWLCLQGDDAEKYKYYPYFPDDEWMGRREIAIDSFRKVMSERKDEDDEDEKKPATAAP